ncbi:hypothetical protein B5807_10156 [Epicoccum nigrum]|uniref:Ketoreductase domain-containing protein n=1 Tax=Epicoccum nigrum TaxID=105696 RepID=A0A1Y2LNH3_EPING|nr:hypothetical protein B5807_10156 [Epicoccum nigrum]
MSLSHPPPGPSATTEFKDKVVLITGAGSGIGRAAAAKFHELGANLALCDIDANSLKSLAESLPNSAHALCAVVNVGNSEHVDDFVSRACSDFGGIDMVFNCAGVNPSPIPLEETSDEYFDRLVNANLKGVFNVTRACVPYLAHSLSPAIVNVSSILGTRGSAQQSVYCATKWAVVGLTKSLALELGPRGIRVNCVAPGEVETPTNAEIVQGGDAQERMKGKNALGRLGLPRDVVEVVVFLMGEGARYMNGSVVEVDGGMW